MKTLITGATGTVGRELARILSQGGTSFRVMVRSPERAKALAAIAGVELVTASFDDLESLSRALTGVERAFLLTPSSARAEAQQRGFVDEARRAGVRRIVKLSQWGADAASPARFLRYHAVVEAGIRASGMAFTFLRPNLFMQSLLAFRTSIARQGKIFASAGSAAVSAVDVRDVAAAAAAALTQDGHEGKVYGLTGPAAFTHAEMAMQLSTALGRTVSFVEVPPAAMRGALLEHGFPQWQADGVIEDYAHYRRGEASAVTSGVLDATGQAPRSFAQFARDYASAFA